MLRARVLAKGDIPVEVLERIEHLIRRETLPAPACSTPAGVLVSTFDKIDGAKGHTSNLPLIMSYYQT